MTWYREAEDDISQAEIEIWQENAADYEQKAERYADRDSGKLAAVYWLKAANLHERLAGVRTGEQTRQGHEVRAHRFRKLAERELQDAGIDFGIEGSQESSTPRTHRSAETEENTASAEREAPDISGTEFFEEPPDKDFDDYGGMDDVIDRLQRHVQHPLEHPEFYEKQAVGIENGILLYGPPGTGKSHLAECFAGELGWNWAEVYSSEISSKWVGEAASNIADLFEEARQHQPAVVFLDELDAIASDRSAGPKKTNSERQAVNELLQQLQKIQGEDVLVIGATNKPDDLDSAVTRSGRFNQKFNVGPPDAEARKQILGVQLDEGDREVDWESLQWDKLVQWTQGFSASDLENVAKQAARMSAEQSEANGELVPVHYEHLLEALKEVEPSLDETDDDDEGGPGAPPMPPR